MDTAHFIAFNLTLLAALASPGPAMLMALRTTLVSGRLPGIALGIGLGTAAAVWTLLALLGLQAVFEIVPWAYLALKIIGALYLIYIAVKMWRNAHVPIITVETSAPKLSRAFITGLAVNFSNPKSVLFASAVLLVIFPQNLSISEKSIIVANHMIIEWLAYTAFALTLSTKPARDGYLRAKPIADRIAATVLGLLGLRLILSK